MTSDFSLIFAELLLLNSRRCRCSRGSHIGTVINELYHPTEWRRRMSHRPSTGTQYRLLPEFRLDFFLTEYFRQCRLFRLRSRHQPPVGGKWHLPLQHSSGVTQEAAYRHKRVYLRRATCLVQAKQDYNPFTIYSYRVKDNHVSVNALLVFGTCLGRIVT